MGKQSIGWLLFVSVLIGIQPLGAFQRSSRLHALNEFNVKKNAETLIRENRCTNCYLVNAKLSGMDLSGADLRGANLTGATFIRSTLVGANLSGTKKVGANFSGAQWVDGSICLPGSIGRCVKRRTE
jgi:uncharacterized protein YjbI with pentapeptide repeats